MREGEEKEQGVRRESRGRERSRGEKEGKVKREVWRQWIDRGKSHKSSKLK